MHKRHIWWTILILALGMLSIIVWPKPAIHEADLFIPLQFKSIPPGLTIANTSANGLDLRIRGRQSEIDSVIKTPPVYHLDLSDVTMGVETISISENSVQLPKKISAVRIRPESITLKIEKKTTKTLSVNITFGGTPPDGYHVTKINAEPKTLLVSGPDSILGPMTAVPTRPIDIMSATESFKKEIAIDVPEGADILSETKVITAEITIEEKVIIQILKDIPVQWRNTDYEPDITPPNISIEVKGTEKKLAELNAKNAIDVFVNLEGLSPGVYVRRAVIDLPMGTTLAGASPELFTVSITNKK